MQYTLKYIGEIIGAEPVQADAVISHLITDSRKSSPPQTSLFFALPGLHRDGHDFIPLLYKKGFRYFVVTQTIVISDFPGAIFLYVKDSLHALQTLTAHHRHQFYYPVIGITGSNGKTIVKEWLWQMLSPHHQVVRNPKSYNSQIGVPLSVWQMQPQYDLAIFEAGISEAGEMEKLEKIISPTIGVMTNIGEAHSQGFKDQQHKTIEKLSLFKHAQVLIYCSAQPIVHSAVNELFGKNAGGDGPALWRWGYSADDQLQITGTSKRGSATTIHAVFEGMELSVDIPFSDDAAIENAITCWAVLLYLREETGRIKLAMSQLQAVNMRLELIRGIHQCMIINDSYSADTSSLHIALDFLQQQAGRQQKTVILSDLFQSGLNDHELYSRLSQTLVHYRINRVIGIGTAISHYLDTELLEANNIRINLYENMNAFMQDFRQSAFKDETILVKGARVFAFEKIVHLLEEKLHQTVLSIDLKALAHNVNLLRSHLKPGTKVMGMVKALAYGSGGAEIAGILQYHQVDYLGVAYADEGVGLRQAGIHLPIMVLNVDEHAFDAIVAHNLEPVIFSMQLLKAFNQHIEKEGLSGWPIHIELETGMHRLGFSRHDWQAMISFLQQPGLKVASVFTHLAASEDPAEDEYTGKQYALFNEGVQYLQDHLSYPFLKHLSNTAAVIRHPSLQMDMVRLGIGMYGINPGHEAMALEPVATLKSTIAQIKRLQPGDTVGYNRRGKIEKETIIATVRIGYADGYPRSLSNGKGYMLVHGKRAPVVGTVCMDMTMIDITLIPGASEGDEVLVFGKELPVQELANLAQTIPYEIMTGISERVQRLYFEE